MSDIAARNKAAKRRGAGFETDVTRTLRDMGYDAERLARKGSKDEGDVAVRLGDTTLVIECKATRSIDLSGFVSEAIVEAANYAEHRGLPVPRVVPLVVIKRRNKPITKSYVVVELDEYLRVIGL